MLHDQVSHCMPMGGNGDGSCHGIAGILSAYRCGNKVGGKLINVTIVRVKNSVFLAFLNVSTPCLLLPD